MHVALCFIYQLYPFQYQMFNVSFKEDIFLTVQKNLQYMLHLNLDRIVCLKKELKYLLRFFIP